MSRYLVMVVLIGFVGVAVGEDKKPDDAAMQWTGSVEDEKLKADAGDIIVTEKAFKKVFESWKFAKEMPKVDFAKNVVVVATSVGSRLGGKPVLKDGNLTFPAFGTRDIRPGFRYVLAVFPREGVKTFNGKPLPTE